jgi:general secretion pathway protein E
MIELTKPQRNLIIRAGSLLIAGFAALLLSRTVPGGNLTVTVQGAVGVAPVPVAIAFWGVVGLLLASILSRIGAQVWSMLRKDSTPLPLVRTSDLRVKPGEDISRLPVFKRILGGIATLQKPDPVKFVNELVSAGFSLNASDIHLNPGNDSVSVTMRVHGMLYDLAELDTILYPHVLRRVKVLADLSTFRQDIPQDGHLRFEDGNYTGRVSVMPTNHGERLAIRLSTCNADILNLDTIGMPAEMLETHKAILSRNQGMIILTGPTGSGKSTTMFASLLHIQALRGDTVNIVTLEDPIETDFKGMHQSQVGRSPGMTFASGLRSLLRQDPDIIMLGEIRDDETAQIAMRAAMTGHLLFTTVHAGSTAGIFGRLMQLGIDAAQLSAGIHSVIAQRLCHSLCPECRVEAPLTGEHLQQLKLIGVEEAPEGPFYTSTGCGRCLGKGFIGRSSLFEMLQVTDRLRDMIADGEPSHRLYRQAREDGMATLLDHGLALARQGRVSLMEVIRTVAS